MSSSETTPDPPKIPDCSLLLSYFLLHMKNDEGLSEVINLTWAAYPVLRPVILQWLESGELSSEMFISQRPWLQSAYREPR